MIQQRAIVTFSVPGLHCWPSAPPERAYLATPHRHLFHFRVALDVHHNEREIEYHDLLHLARTFAHSMGDAVPFDAPTRDFGARSCETLAAELIAQLRAWYPERSGIVQVLEDGECGTQAAF